MVTFLILSNNQAERESYALERIGEYHIHPLDVATLETENSIGIEDIRNFQKQIILKPFKGEAKAVVIKNAHKLTTEAQNALLKTLEEPPANTYIFLTAESNNTLLPTILSRTSILTLKEDKLFTEEALQEIALQLENIRTASIGDRLKLAEILAKDKSEAGVWLEKAIIISRRTMVEHLETAYAYLPLLEHLQKTYTTLRTTNVNARFTLENFFLTI